MTIVASDHHAAEAEQDVGVFTVTRTGGTEASLLVFYELSGTARNGVDYLELPRSITIPAGAASASITVKPINDSLAEGTETVVATLVPSPTVSPIEPYRVGFPSSDVLLLADNDGDSKPVVTIVATDPVGAEIPEVPPGLGIPQRYDPAQFTVWRTGRTQAALEVRYRIEGTARNGVDYQTLSGVVRIPSGSAFGTIEVSPIDDGDVEGTETVVVILAPNDCDSSPLPGACYTLGEHSQATASIEDNDTMPHSPPTIGIVGPTEGATFLAPARVEIVALAHGANAWIRGVEFFAGDRRIGVVNFNLFLDSFSFIWNDVPSGDYTLTAKATDSLGATASSGPVHITVKSGDGSPIVLVSKGSSWKYLDNGSDQGAAWREPGFSDTEWKSGPAQLGFGDGDEATVLRAGNEARRFVTYFFRRTFEIAGVEGISGLTLRLLRDDGAVVYLNGHEVFRSNMPDGPITFNTLALQAVGPHGEIVFLSAGVDPHLLVNGRNVLAVEVHQVSSESTDVSFDLELDNDEPPPNALPTVKMAQPAGGSTFVAPATINIVAQVRDPDGWVGRVEFFANERKIGEQSVVFIREPDPGQVQSFSFEWKEVPPGEYTLVAKATDNRGGKGTSDPVRVRAGEATPQIPVVTIFARDPFAREGTNSSGEINTSTFVLRRTGGTNADLSVFLSVHGTAENGVDYETLPNSVTIPAGRHTTRIVVKPIRDEQKELLETVLLALEADPSLGPIARYTVGQPSKAAAAIADSDQPPAADLRTTDGLFHLCLPGENGSGFRLEGSTDLTHWLPLCTNVVTDGAIHFVDPDADGHAHRFYRVVPETSVDLDD